MSTIFPTTLSRFTAAILLLATAACGGGGGDSTSTQAPASGDVPRGPSTGATGTNVSAPVVSSIVTVVSPANYDPTSENGAAYEYLNSQRQLCGFGLLQQDARIDIAATAHASYLAANNIELSHYENKDQFPTDFIGVAPWNRMVAAGYPYQSSGEVAGTVGGNKLLSYGVNIGKAGVMDLFTAPYHGVGMLSSFRDAGFGFVRQNTANTRTRTLQVIDFGTTSTRTAQLLDAATVATYPCNGSTGILSRSYASESPTPIEGRDIGTTPIGHPIYLKARDGNTLTVTSSDLRAVGTNESLPLILRSKANDTNGDFPDDSTVFLMPNTPLAKNTSYLFKANVVNNGAVKDISFTFSTGAY